ncbi:hypothetical protein TUMEXPCC7403_14915 [Tumidithrix helvetica PCC 7403]|uniref:hypothetical protein n=1 Tax=Tumidithrix helvetica TaxID=3457545 RepID=UPI003C8914DC
MKCGYHLLPIKGAREKLILYPVSIYKVLIGSMEDKNIDFEIRRNKDKKLDKHYGIYVDCKRIRIIGFRIKNLRVWGKEEQVIELVSKIKPPHIRGNVEIEVKRNENHFKVKGHWHSGFSEPGNFIETFIIVEVLHGELPE